MGDRVRLYPRSCPQCGNPVYEDDSDYCELCEEIAIERSQKRAEWDHFHDGEPCPEIELQSLPTKGDRT